jgi:RNA recognition motif-containing protein
MAKEDSKMEEVNDEHTGKVELFATGLSFDTTEDSLRGMFSPYGTLTKVKLLNGKGKAFIEYDNHASARKA